MEWAHSTSSRNGRLLATVLSADGTQNHRSLEELHKCGVPTSRSFRRRRANFRLSDLSEVSPDEYLDCFGIKTQPGAGYPTMYALRTQKNTTWVLPSLALIRGLFHPTKLFLADLFRPQAVGRMAITDPTNTTQFKVVAPWSYAQLSNAGSPMPTLEWLMWDPLARRLANSIHRHAMAGELDLDLLPIELHMNARGIARGSTYFVTDLCATGVLMSKDSVKNPEELHPLFRSIAGDVTCSLNVERRGDSGIRSTEAEWESLKKHLRVPKAGPPVRTDLKRVFDNILERAAGDLASWAKLEGSQIAVSTHRTYYRKWASTGEFQAMVDELNRMRSSPR